ncbi:MAG: hypothetical protein Q7R79_05085, partial [bacterium]|nr:hypothetical protein [bacterium]
IIGDDASGRIPTIILGDILKGVYQKKGILPPKIRFFAGSTNLGNSREREYKITRIAKGIQEAIRQQKEEGSKKRILFVTDTIATGSSIKVFATACKELGIDFDIATVSLYSPEHIRQKLGELANSETKIAYGMEGTTPELYYNKKLSGVEKEPEEVYSRPLDRIKYGNDTSRVIAEARQDAKIVTAHLLQGFESSLEERKKMELVYDELVKLRGKVVGKDIKKMLLILDGDAGFLYEKLKAKDRLRELENFLQWYEQYQENPLFIYLLRGKSKEEQEIIDILLRTRYYTHWEEQGVSSAIDHILGL